jgi:hypothetical protein
MSASGRYPLVHVDNRACALGSCPRCGSTLLQSHGWKELTADQLLLRLRCPECQLWMVGSFEQSKVAAYDEEQRRARRLIEADYAAVLRRNMEDLAERLALCFERDLIGPDDFAGPRGRAAAEQGLQSAPEASR